MIRNSFFKHPDILVFFVIPFLISCSDTASDFYAGNLKCEYMVNPVGIDTREPRFTWQMTDTVKGAEQSAFRVLVGTDSSSVAAGSGDAWDSGKISSGNNLISYTGKPLDPFTKYFWSVVIWDRNGELSGIAPPASFETGMVDMKNWKGSWISDTRDTDIKPAPAFRKSFNVGKKIRSARAYVAVAGLYEFYLNGKRVGDHRLDPAYTRFDRRTLYLTYDVTSFIQNGENAIGLVLGNGWYNHQSTAVWYFDKAPWRARPKFCMDLRISFDDNSEMTVSSGTDWMTSLSPVIFNSIYTAEHYDARLEQPGWNMPGFDDSKWEKPIAVAAPSQNIVAQIMHPIRLVEEIPAKTLTRLDNNTWLFDLGRNIAGVSRLKVTGTKGTTIRMKHAERLDKKGWADQSNIDVHYRPTDDKDPFQTDIFILSGKGEEIFMPEFNYKGFQYIEITSDRPVTLNKESLSGYFMHSDVPPAGSVTSSDTLLNRIWWATNNSYLSNLFGYPTDCPQREKNGWTGDAHTAIETGLYNFDAITVYEKWLNDHLDEQQPNGVLPAIIPTDGWGYHWANGVDWTSTIAIIPWKVYLFYGDPHLLFICYDGIKRYVDHITEMSPSGLTDWGLGDWIPVRSVASKELTSTVFYYTDAMILSKAARLAGKLEDYEKYSALAEKIKNSLNDKYLNRETGVYNKGLQTELSVPLMYGIVPEDMKSKVAANLAEAVRANNNHIDVGLHGTKAILNALSENGYPDMAFKLATCDSFPSWGWWIKNGATTLFENWPIESKSDISMNHIMFGEIGAWMYKALGGIFPDEEYPGFKNIILKPQFVSGLGHFEAKHEGPYGTIISSWKREGDKIIYDVTIPANSSATLFLSGKDLIEGHRAAAQDKYMDIKQDRDGGYIIQIKSGEYSFTVNRP